MLRNLVDLESDQLQIIFTKEKVFSIIVEKFLIALEKEAVLKVIEISMDFLEFLLSSLPECLFKHIEILTKCLLQLLQNKKEQVIMKANDLFNLS